ncbi:hypothetical protein ACA910_006957 [Epithemia clementina (nom. ined.)]
MPVNNDPTTQKDNTRSSNNDEPDAKRLRTSDDGDVTIGIKDEEDASGASITGAGAGTSSTGFMAPDPTALAADIAAALPVTPTPDAANRAAVEAVEGANYKHEEKASPSTSPAASDHNTFAERQKSEIQAALEKVKEDNLKKEPSISKLVTEGLWGDDPRAVENALTQVADLSYGNPNAGPNRVTISLTGGLLAIVKALQRFPRDPEVQAAGGRALQNLALDQNNKSGIAGAGGIDILVKAMTDFPQHEGVQMGGCGTFQNLVWGNDENRMNILKAGGIPLLIKAMYIHEDASEIQEWACGAVYLLSVGEKEVQHALFENKALSAIANTLENNRGDGGILEKGRSALARLLWP